MDNSVFCILPYTHCMVQTDGKIKLCCNSLEEDNPHIRDQSFINLINNPLHVRVRNQMENGIQPKECRRCFEQERNGSISYRQEQNYINQGSAKTVGLRYLDVRFNNTCNLKCVMCSSSYSSLWVEDERKLSNSSGIVKQDMSSRVEFHDKNKFKWSIENDVVSSIKNNINTLERIHFAGGEPLLSKQHTELLDYLIESGNSQNLFISYNTNITLIDSGMINRWNKFKQVKVFLSIDGVGDVLEYIRFPIKYDDVLTVFDLIQSESLANIKYVFHYTASALNITSLPEFIRYKINLPYSKISPKQLFTVDCVWNPSYLAINTLPNSLINDVNDNLDRIKDEFPDYAQSVTSIQKKINIAYNTTPVATLDDLFNYCKELDQIRNTDSSALLKDIRKYL